MPIRAENRARYPADWRELSHWVRFERAGGQCECDGHCGLDHGGRCAAKHGAPHPVTGSRVVLTTAHLDHTPEHRDPANLAAMCQLCHNRYDGPTRRRDRAARLRAARALGDLFERADLTAAGPKN